MLPTEHLPELLVVAYENGRQQEAELFADTQSCQCIPVEQLSDLNPPYALCYRNSGVSLEQFGKGAPGPISASFLQGKSLHRLNFGGGKGQMIAKAVGIKSRFRPMIVDATAGLGQDAFVLATLGCQVTMLERSPFVVELLRSALNERELEGQQALIDIYDRLSLISADASDWLSKQKQDAIEVVYLDPMYPHREKSALVKKEMKAFQDLIGVDEDSESSLLSNALAASRYRIVVKRPRKGAYLANQTPDLKLEGKSVRYDIYTKHKLPDAR